MIQDHEYPESIWLMAACFAIWVVLMAIGLILASCIVAVETILEITTRKMFSYPQNHHSQNAWEELQHHSP